MTRDVGNAPKQLFDMYHEDPEEADRLIFGRESYPDRRGFFRKAGLATMGALIGTAIPFHRNMPSGFIPMALAESGGMIGGKDGLTVFNDRPVNAETPAHLLDDAITPTSRHFIRNNGVPPENVSPHGWELTIDGLVDKPMKLTLKYDITIEGDRLVGKVKMGIFGKAKLTGQRV